MQRKFCYGSLGPFVVTIVFTIFGLLKETLPMFFEVGICSQLKSLKMCCLGLIKIFYRNQIT